MAVHSRDERLKFIEEIRGYQERTQLFQSSIQGWTDELTIKTHSTMLEFLRKCTFQRCPEIKLWY